MTTTIDWSTWRRQDSATEPVGPEVRAIQGARAAALTPEQRRHLAIAGRKAWARQQELALTDAEVREEKGVQQ